MAVIDDISADASHRVAQAKGSQSNNSIMYWLLTIKSVNNMHVYFRVAAVTALLGI